MEIDSCPVFFLARCKSVPGEFGTVSELNQVMESGPWSFKFDLVVLKRIMGSHEINLHSFTHAEVWVQAHTKFPDLLTQQNLLDLVKAAGQPISFPRMVVTPEGKHFRVKLVVPISEPIRDKITAMHPAVGTFKVYLTYEKIKGICNFCGLLGHDYMWCTDWARYSRLALSPNFSHLFTNSPPSPFRFGNWISDASMLRGILLCNPPVQQMPTNTALNQPPIPTPTTDLTGEAPTLSLVPKPSSNPNGAMVPNPQ